MSTRILLIPCFHSARKNVRAVSSRVFYYYYYYYYHYYFLSFQLTCLIIHSRRDDARSCAGLQDYYVHATRTIHKLAFPAFISSFSIGCDLYRARWRFVSRTAPLHVHKKKQIPYVKVRTQHQVKKEVQKRAPSI